MPGPAARNDGRAIDVASDLAAVRTCAEIATDRFVVAIVDEAPWLAQVPGADLARLSQDAARLEGSILRVLANSSLNLALQTQYTTRLARHACQVELRRPREEERDSLSVGQRGLIGRVAPRLERRRRGLS